MLFDEINGYHRDLLGHSWTVCPLYVGEVKFCDILAVVGYHVNVSSSFYIRETGFAIDLLFGSVLSLTTFRDDPN